MPERNPYSETWQDEERSVESLNDVQPSLHPSLTIRRNDRLFSAEWNNREIAKSSFIAIFLGVFWLIWTPVTFYVTTLAISGTGPWPFLLLWLVFGYLGVIAIPVTWMLRYTSERIEIDDEEYRHIFVNLPWFFPKRWPVSEIRRVTFGRVGDESIATLNIWRGAFKRDMIAYWGRSDIKRDLFHEIAIYLEETERDIQVIDHGAMEAKAADTNAEEM